MRGYLGPPHFPVPGTRVSRTIFGSAVGFPGPFLPQKVSLRGVSCLIIPVLAVLHTKSPIILFSNISRFNARPLTHEKPCPKKSGQPNRHW